MRCSRRRRPRRRAAPQLSPQYMLSAARLAEIQAEYHADDIEIDPARMARWSEARVRAYFEAGGVDHLSLWKRVSARDVAGSSNSNGSGRDESPLNSRRFSVATAAHLMQRKGSPRFSDRLSAHLGELEAAAAEEEAAPSRRRYSMRLTSHLLEKAQGEANGDGGAPHHALASRTSFEDELLAEASKCAAAAVTIQSAQRAKYDRALAAAMESLIGGEGYARLVACSRSRARGARRRGASSPRSRPPPPPPPRWGCASRSRAPTGTGGRACGCERVGLHYTKDIYLEEASSRVQLDGAARAAMRKLRYCRAHVAKTPLALFIQLLQSANGH